jgi:hypothetical protein
MCNYKIDIKKEDGVYYWVCQVCGRKEKVSDYEKEQLDERT